MWLVVYLKANLTWHEKEMNYLATLRPRKNRAISWSDDCQGRPRARTTVLLSTSSSLELDEPKKQLETKTISEMVLLKMAVRDDGKIPTSSLESEWQFKAASQSTTSNREQTHKKAKQNEK
jgi:hypothetical protein